MDSNNPEVDMNEAEYEAWRNSQWQLAGVLSNPQLDDQGTFTVEEKVNDGNITYKLALNDFLGFDGSTRTVIRGTGFCDSKCTKDIRQDETDPYTIKFETRSNADADDWTTGTCNLRPHLKLNHGILFGGDDVAPTVVVSKTPTCAAAAGGEEETTTTYELSAEQAKAYVGFEQEEKQEKQERDAKYKSNAEHPVVFQPPNAPGTVTVNGLFGDGAKLGKLINLFINGDPHPGKKKYRKDAKGHEYFGCEKHEHDLDKGTWKDVCT
ncbi:hypothetical protein V8F06_004767 [Rhypophila decipiens]